MRHKSVMQIFFAGAVLVALCACYAERDDLSREVSSQAKGNNEFAMELYHTLKGEDGNLFFSPYSISTALAMTYEGAEGETAKQMEQTLNLDLPKKQVPVVFAEMKNTLEATKKGEGYQLSIANSLWGQKGYEFLDSFLESLEKNYGAGLRTTDFKTETEKSRKKINSWVEEKTKGKIEDLFKPGVLQRSTRLVLCNAIYFKGDWDEQFDEEDTKEAKFYSEKGEVEVPLMRKKLEVPYAETDTFQAVELPYKGKTVTMMILLPKTKDGISRLEEDISAEQIEEAIERMSSRDVRVYIPRFKTTVEFALGDVLADMGMPLAFSTKADFSGMNGKRDLFLDAVLHKAFVEVNEEGTEAAAATGVVMRMTSMPKPPVEFRADHPFLFLIRDKSTGSILFVGRIMKP